MIQNFKKFAYFLFLRIILLILAAKESREDKRVY